MHCIEKGHLLSATVMQGANMVALTKKLAGPSWINNLGITVNVAKGCFKHSLFGDNLQIIH